MGAAQSTRKDLQNVRSTPTRAAIKVGFAVSRVRILGSVLKSESAPKQALESVFRVYKHRFREAFSKCFAKAVLIHARETDSEACSGAFFDYKTDPEILTRLTANPTLRAARKSRIYNSVRANASFGKATSAPNVLMSMPEWFIVERVSALSSL